MQAIRAIYDGQNIKPLDPIKTDQKTEVLIIFPDSVEKISPVTARGLLRGAGKGEHLIDKLLKLRAEDIELDRK